MEDFQEKQRAEVKPTARFRSQRSPVVQRKLDEANADLAKLSPEDLAILLGRKKP